MWRILQLAIVCALPAIAHDAPFPETKPLTWDGDIASRLVDAADAFLLREIANSESKRAVHWSKDSIEPSRLTFRRMIGAVEPRQPFDELRERRFIGTSGSCDVYAITWPAFADVFGEGILLEPSKPSPMGPLGNIVVIPDADQLPEALAGWVGDVPPEQQYARILAERGYRVVIPTIINRATTHGKLSNREFLYRPAFELGRHLIGYEVQKIEAIIDWLHHTDNKARIGIAGWGEGGLLALYTAAVNPKVARTFVSGYFGPRETIWEEPAYRNVFGLLSQFGDAEIASLIAPRQLYIDTKTPGPELIVPAGTGGKPGRLTSVPSAAAEAELARAISLTCAPETDQKFVTADFNQFAAVDNFRSGLQVPEISLPDSEARHARQFRELDRHNQQVLAESPYTRATFMKDLKTNSLDAFKESVAPYRDHFAKEIIGTFNYPLIHPQPRSRLFLETETVTIYEVVLDVYEDFFAYGLLCWPKDINGEEKRPVVVCQHGLEGRPQMLIGEDGYHSYKGYALKLAERGFITFAPQHLYIFEDRFRTLQFKANAVKKTLFSLMVPQHEQLTRWLGSLTNVDSARIAFYGLSYGGKSAMRIPPLVPAYCLSICSADFNDWVWKNASTRSPYSYAWMGEYEIFEFNLGSTFNYSEMAALIAPRPFMVERGHFDGVAPDERVALEFAKVRHLYAAKLKIPERTEIEWFDGPHTINEQGTFRFLHRHLDWPERLSRVEPSVGTP